MLFQVVFIHFLQHTFFSSSSCSAKKKKKVSLWRRKTGKEKITLSRENRQEKENRSCGFFFFFCKEKSPGIETTETFVSFSDTHIPSPLFSSWSWLACTFWQARRCLFCYCCTGWSHQKRCSQEMFCVGITTVCCSPALSSLCCTSGKTHWTHLGKCFPTWTPEPYLRGN